MDALPVPGHFATHAADYCRGKFGSQQLDYQYFSVPAPWAQITLMRYLMLYPPSENEKALKDCSRALELLAPDDPERKPALKLLQRLKRRQANARSGVSSSEELFDYLRVRKSNHYQVSLPPDPSPGTWWVYLRGKERLRYRIVAQRAGNYLVEHDVPGGRGVVEAWLRRRGR